MDATPETATIGLPEVLRCDDGDTSPAGLCRRSPERFRVLVEAGLAHYGDVPMKVGDLLSKRWLRRTANPYLGEIDAVAEIAGIPGAHLLNLSYEWSCTAGVGPDPSGSGARLLRTLDWPLDGLGSNVIAALQKGPAGEYWNVTWPGFSGIATAMAPGRFAVVLNQPPLRRWTPFYPLDWLIDRLRFLASNALPPAHLLRQVFDECRSYAEARKMLRETPVAMPAYFTVSGVEADEGCVIERSETRAWVRESPTQATNHWIDGTSERGHERGQDSVGRLSQMERTRDTAADGFDWVTPPILNDTTRLAVVTNAATGKLLLRGYEIDGPVTRDFSL